MSVGVGGGARKRYWCARKPHVTCASGGGLVLVLQNGCRCCTGISLKIGRCCCSIGPGLPPAWPATVPGGAGTTHGAVADGSMPFLWHKTDTHMGGHEQRHSTYTAYTGSSVYGLGCGWGTLADMNQKHWMPQQRAFTAGNSNGNTHTVVFLLLYTYHCCVVACVYLVLYLVRSTILLSYR